MVAEMFLNMEYSGSVSPVQLRLIIVILPQKWNKVVVDSVMKESLGCSLDFSCINKISLLFQTEESIN